MKPNRTRPRGDPNGGPPGKPPGNRSQHVTDLPPSYEELGIGKMQSSYWQAEARQRQKEAGKQGGRGKKKNLAETILQGFPRYERATDTQLARASGEENLPETIPEGFQGTKTLPQTIGEGFPKRKTLGQKCPKVFEPIKAVEAGRKTLVKQFTKVFPGRKPWAKNCRRVSKRGRPYFPPSRIAADNRGDADASEALLTLRSLGGLMRRKHGRYSVGARCPRCGAVTRVLKTHCRTGLIILRYRRCTACGWRAKTIESIR